MCAEGQPELPRADDGEVFVAVIFAVSGAVLVEGDVERPAQAVLDAQMRSHGLCGARREKARRRELIATRARNLAVALELRLDPDDGREPQHRRLVGIARVRTEPDDIVDDGAAARLEAAVVGIDRFVTVGDRSLRIGGIGFDVGERCGPVAFSAFGSACPSKDMLQDGPLQWGGSEGQGFTPEILPAPL